ncbi:ribosome hibernation-promoting factor, HPF/YfiA family [Tellurirhabdus bombi]|uniref:ribosome hibernation-promoting factor, HPF/YfiA family n=1 Tax=Tellurirhabdus bombi TaxID=2907205 RepID=UPI001F40AB58|nr:ribosome-associated translation inhibitor RaiA [Tellurirhabdus bombi]
MRIQVNAVHFTADQKLLDFIQRKLDKLDTFHDRIVSAEVFLRLDGNDSNKIRMKIFEVKLFLPGDSLFISERNQSFEAAIDLAVDRLKNLLVKHKDKQRHISNRDINRETKDSQQDLVEVDALNEDGEI